MSMGIIKEDIFSIIMVWLMNISRFTALIEGFLFSFYLCYCNEEDFITDF